jgi:hypothetical protein
MVAATLPAAHCSPPSQPLCGPVSGGFQRKRINLCLKTRRGKRHNARRETRRETRRASGRDSCVVRDADELLDACALHEDATSKPNGGKARFALRCKELVNELVREARADVQEVSGLVDAQECPGTRNDSCHEMSPIDTVMCAQQSEPVAGTGHIAQAVTKEVWQHHVEFGDIIRKKCSAGRDPLSEVGGQSAWVCCAEPPGEGSESSWNCHSK